MLFKVNNVKETTKKGKFFVKSQGSFLTMTWRHKHGCKS